MSSFNIAVVGEGMHIVTSLKITQIEVGVGKSACVIRFVTVRCFETILTRNKKRFVENYDPTLEDSYRQEFSRDLLNSNRMNQVVDDETLVLDILDTAPHDQVLIRAEYMKKLDGCIFVYSITSKSSIDAIPRHIENVLTSKEVEKLPMVLVGNKSDLSDREVSTEEGETLAKTYGCPFFETSAKENKNVTEAFHQIVREVRREKAPSSKKAAKK